MTDMSPRHESDNNYPVYTQPFRGDTDNFYSHRRDFVNIVDRTSPPLTGGPEHNGAECFKSNGGEHLPDLQLDCIKELHARGTSETRRFEHEASKQAQDEESKRIEEYTVKVDKEVGDHVKETLPFIPAIIADAAERGQDVAPVYEMPYVDESQLTRQPTDIGTPGYDDPRRQSQSRSQGYPRVNFDHNGICSPQWTRDYQNLIWDTTTECRRMTAIYDGDTATLQSIAGVLDPRSVRSLRPAEQELLNDLTKQGLRPFYVERGDNRRYIYVTIP